MRSSMPESGEVRQGKLWWCLCALQLQMWAGFTIWPHLTGVWPWTQSSSFSRGTLGVWISVAPLCHPTSKETQWCVWVLNWLRRPAGEQIIDLTMVSCSELGHRHVLSSFDVCTGRLDVGHCRLESRCVCGCIGGGDSRPPTNQSHITYTHCLPFPLGQAILLK